MKKMSKQKPEDLIFVRTLPDSDESFIDTLENKALEKEAKSKVFVIVIGSFRH